MQKTKKCVHCKEEINLEATRCPKCGGKNYVLTTGKKILMGIIIFFGIMVVVGTFNADTNTDSNTNGSRDIMSKAFAKHTIENILKSPSTAEFSNVDAYELSDSKDVWEVDGYVDSQNSFGAMIRNTWKVQLDFRDGKGGTVKSVTFDGKKVL